MGVAHLGPEEMEYFNDPTRRHPPAVRADEQLRGYAEAQGGLVLEYWQLAMGRIWGRPYMMTLDEAATRLGRPISEIQLLHDETNRALGWVTDSPESDRSRDA